ncbi:MAG TPA: hypothetical protein VK611_26095 [Acidimicrobiales bacterium]|nr:hypothetical protein [Acidimicrobiales bacterium]
MSDLPEVPDDDRSEVLDDEMLGDEEFPPDRFVDPDDERAEPLPDDERPVGWDEPEVEVLAQGVPDYEEDVLAETVEEEDFGALAVDDEFSGDETTRDVATERVPPPAEAVAVHIDDDDAEDHEDDDEDYEDDDFEEE